jgi:DNA-binding NarL/FixJ family response regulator
MREKLVGILSRQPGWTVCGETRNGLKAVLMANDLKPDLVILDLVMPMLDGLRAAAEIAKILPAVPIVLYSVEVLPELEMQAKEFGIWAIVPKSAEENLLIETLNRLLGASPAVVPSANTQAPEIAPVEEVQNGFQTTALPEPLPEPD